METTITALQQEVERLNIIISALAEQNRQLKTENSLLKQTRNSENNAAYSSAEIQDNIKPPASSFPENREGGNQTVSSFPENREGVTKTASSFPENKEGVNQIFYSSPENREGVNQTASSFPQNSKGVSTINISLVKNGLRKYLLTRSYATIDKAAKIIMLLYQNPKQPQKELKHLTGLSDDGIVKHIAMLKRKGLIVRTAYQTYTLTETSINIIKEAMQK